MLAFVMVKYRATYHILADELTNTVALTAVIIPAIKMYVCVPCKHTLCPQGCAKLTSVYCTASAFLGFLDSAGGALLTSTVTYCNWKDKNK